MHASSVIFNLVINVNSNLNLILTRVYIAFWESDETYNLHPSSKWGLVTGVRNRVGGFSLSGSALQNPMDVHDPGCGNGTSVCCLKATGSRQCNLWDRALNKSWETLGSLLALLWSVYANCFCSVLWRVYNSNPPERQGPLLVCMHSALHNSPQCCLESLGITVIQITLTILF